MLPVSYKVNYWDTLYTAGNSHIVDFQIKALAKFAPAMMRKMAEFDYSKFELENTPDFQLR